MTRGIVIVGAGLAGYQAAGALRRAGYAGRVTVVGDEAHRPYDRPPLSKELLAGRVDRAFCFYPCDKLDVEWRLGVAVAGLSVHSRVVYLADGEEMPFDRLVIATGRRARQWPVPIELAGVHTLRSLEDSSLLGDAVQKASRIAIVGAGFIGCEVAATLAERGLGEVTLIEMGPHPMPALGPLLGRRAAEIHAAHGVACRTSTSVAGFEGRDRVEAVRLSSGEILECDLVLLALGSVPNSEWLATSGVEMVGGAVRCDEHCFAVGTDRVVVAGDVAAFPHPLAGRLVSIEHWSNARDMGRAAAANLLAAPGDRSPFAPVPTFWSDQYDVKIKSAGLIGEANRFSIVQEDPSRGSVVVEAHRDDELVGAVAFNANRAIAEYQRKLDARVTVHDGGRNE
jgi:NADPH-dependent 2,4-dienoyl-CoA reductase/sulfur reductase-like enzyme